MIYKAQSIQFRARYVKDFLLHHVHMHMLCYVHPEIFSFVSHYGRSLIDEHEMEAILCGSSPIVELSPMEFNVAPSVSVFRHFVKTGLLGQAFNTP